MPKLRPDSPAHAKKTYRLKLSEFARLEIDNRAEEARYNRLLGVEGADVSKSVSRDTYTRANLSSYFHENYVSNLPEILRRARAWSLDERPYTTDVRLTDAQVAAVLKMAKADHIDPKPNIMNPNSTNGIINYLLSTFLEAVLRGYIYDNSR